MEKRTYFVVSTEHDCDQESFPDSPHISNGAIIMETYLKNATILKAAEIKKKVGDRYGKVAIAKLVFLTDEEFKQQLKET